MNIISTQEIQHNLIDTLTKVANNHEHIAIETSEHQN